MGKQSVTAFRLCRPRFRHFVIEQLARLAGSRFNR